MTRSVMTICLIVLFVASSANADLPLNWIYSPDSNQAAGSPESVNWVGSNVVIGTLTGENAQQQVGIYGVSAALPMNYNNVGFLISFDWLFKTWDSYNPDVGVGTGYWDSFSATITKGDHYWDEDLTDSIANDPNIEEIFVLEAGAVWGDGILETYSDSWTTFLWVPPTTDDQYYLNLVIDTSTIPTNNGAFPSWGEFSDVGVQAVPAPGAVLLGVLGLGLVGRLRRRLA